MISNCLVYALFILLFADLIKEELIDETHKPAALKLLENYDESSDDEPPEEISIVKESAPVNDTSLTNANDKLCSTSETDGVLNELSKVQDSSDGHCEVQDSTSLVKDKRNDELCSAIETESVLNECSEVQDSISLVKEKPNDKPCSTLGTESVLNGHSEVQDSLVKDDSKALNSVVKTDISTNVSEECEKTNIERGQKRKKPPKKDFKPLKRTPPMRTPRTEVVEKKSALLEAVSLRICLCAFV